HVPMAVKFLTMTCVLATSVLCLLLPAAYTLGQRVTEEHLQDRALTHLRLAAQQASRFSNLQDRMRLLQRAVLGMNGYVFAVDDDGMIRSEHPRGLRQIGDEGWYRLRQRLHGAEGVWVDRVKQHRVIAFLRLANRPITYVSVAYPSDFAAPLRHFVLLSLLVVFEVLIVLFVFGRYYVKGITTPLGELTATVERIARHGNLAQRVPITTNDELSELARSFNRMVEELQASKSDLEENNRRLEQTTRDLSVLNQEMEDLLHVVSHDLRAPLINIQGFSKRLETEANGRQEPRTAESLRFIAKGVEKMDALLASLLAISRVGRKADPAQLHDLDAVLDDVLATFEHQLKEQAIQVIRHPLPKAVPCRRNEINQVFSNLVSNAINYMGAADRRFIEIGGAATPEGAEVFVRDTGVGIAAEDQERIFGMFTRLQAVDVPGEGVGLTYVRKILRSHGGAIRVESSRGQGSLFTVTLPMKRHAAATRG
ncbi:MAG: ATP-binding protein, partial [Dehalococcoidia bacterium]|nr:ATP-binding protein [Dehalococcoidia bacterium]